MDNTIANMNIKFEPVDTQDIPKGSTIFNREDGWLCIIQNDNVVLLSKKECSAIPRLVERWNIK